MTIHERIIARLDKVRQSIINNNTSLYGPNLAATFDMAADDVRRKCQRCDDTGTTHTILNSLLLCDCNRPAYLEECERRLNG